MSFELFFEAATDHPPYDYQCRLAGGDSGTRCRSQLINIPTGLGKTAAVVLAWLWNRVKRQDSKWPCRLVYCLPMRTLVEQTQEEVARWIANLAAAEQAGKIPLDQEAQTKLQWLKTRSPVVLMGGEENDDARREWDIYPEEPAILIGTQDMLLSRALNRGYGISRYRWPMHFGLLNNDCLWVMDETQLMGPGLNTACQLEAFRVTFGSIPANRCASWYMSATGNPEHLKTREWRDTTRPADFAFGLSAQEEAAASGPIYDRRRATKLLRIERTRSFDEAESPEDLLSEVLAKHQAMLTAVGTDQELPKRTLIICNTVDRAVNLHVAVAKMKPDGCDLVLLHSRFRPPERKAQMERLKKASLANFPRGQIVVATQVIEAGVDLSSAVLWSEVAPLVSLVQRLGRLNRSGEFGLSGWKPEAIIVGVGVEAVPPREAKEACESREKRNIGRCLPYERTACETAWTSLVKFSGDACPANLQTVQGDIATSIPRCPYSLQRHEFTDFFDTDANLSLGFTDVSPFVRSLDDDTDLQVLWREELDGKPDFIPDFQRDEMCSVPLSKARHPEARKILERGWLWRGKESGWISVRDAGIAPGMTILLPVSAGGYDSAAGWTGREIDNKHGSRYRPEKDATDEEMLSCLASGWRSIASHTAEVVEELERLLNELFAAEDCQLEREALLNAALWHDVGKNHPQWQQAVVDALAKASIAGKAEHLPFAKFSLSDSPSLRKQDGSFRFLGKELKQEINRLRRFFRPGIAHEVASALAFRQNEQDGIGTKRSPPGSRPSLLTEYVVISHHGHVRKVLRDEIPRFPSDSKDNDTVRGVKKGSEVPILFIDGKRLGCASLSTDCRCMGRDANGHESYTRGVLRLLEHYGPIRLAFFEAVFRAADIRASIAASSENKI